MDIQFIQFQVIEVNRNVDKGTLMIASKKRRNASTYGMITEISLKQDLNWFISFEFSFTHKNRVFNSNVSHLLIIIMLFVPKNEHMWIILQIVCDSKVKIIRVIVSLRIILYWIIEKDYQISWSSIFSEFFKSNYYKISTIWK